MVSEINTSNRSAAIETLEEDRLDIKRMEDMCVDIALKSILTSSTLTRSFQEKVLPPGYLLTIVSRVPDFAVEQLFRAVEKLVRGEEIPYFHKKCMRHAVDLFNEVVRVFSRSVREETTSRFTQAFKEKFGCVPLLYQKYASYDDATRLVLVGRIKSIKMYQSRCLALANYEDIPLLPQIVYSRAVYENQWDGWDKFLSIGNGLGRWFQRLIDELRYLEEQVPIFSKANPRSQRGDLSRELKTLISRGLKDLGVRGQIEDILGLIQELRWGTHHDITPQVANKLLHLEERLIDLKNQVYKFEKYVESLASCESFIDRLWDLWEWLSLTSFIWNKKNDPQIVTDQPNEVGKGLNDLSKELFDIKKVVTNIDWESLQKIRDAQMSEDIPPEYNPFLLWS